MKTGEKMNDKKLVFVVDDDESMNYALTRHLTNRGFEVKALGNGFEVLLMCLYLKPDLIVSDIRMPKLDGVTLLEGLSNSIETRDIPVIFMSAYPTGEVMEKAKTLGAKYFLIKPFPLEYLDDMIERVMSLESRSQNRAGAEPGPADRWTG